MDLRDAHRRSQAVVDGVVGEVLAADLDRPTPCAQWRLRELLAHMIGQNHGFAAAAEGTVTGVETFAPQAFGPDLQVDFAASSKHVTAAFAAADPDAEVWLPEIRDGRFPLRVAIGFHLVDNVAHGWDVARTIGAPVTFDDEVLAVALRIARQVPDGENRQQPGASFRPGLPVPPTGGTFDEILGLLGRSPDWTP